MRTAFPFNQAPRTGTWHLARGKLAQTAVNANGLERNYRQLLSLFAVMQTHVLMGAGIEERSPRRGLREGRPSPLG